MHTQNVARAVGLHLNSKEYVNDYIDVYNMPFFAVALRPNAGHGLLILEVF